MIRDKLLVVMHSEKVHEQEQSPHDAHTSQKPQGSKKKSSFRANLTTAILALGVIGIPFLIIGFVVQNYEVDGPSMETTLSNGNRLIVIKAGKTVSRITNKPYIPKRYDIIVFNHRGDYGFEEQVTKKQLIKRVIGVPGDRVVVKDGVVTIYNQQNPDGFLVDREGPESKIIKVTSGNIDQKIGKDEVFVMGDNRDNSLDSRVFGAVSSSDIVGELAARIYPFNQTTRF
jgi:signal peptidase I